MISITNTRVFVGKNDVPIRILVKNRLFIEEYDKKKDVTTRYDLYYQEGDCLVFSKGLLHLIPEILDKNYCLINRLLVREVYKPELEIDKDCLDEINIKNLLDGITLRDDQVESIIEVIKNKRGILQLSTGSGKTEIIAGFLKLMYLVHGYYPPTMILEPSVYLVKSTIDRLSKYGIPSKKLDNKESGIEGIVITHPSSVSRMIKTNPSNLMDLKILLSDEGHHLQAFTWSRIIENALNIEYSIALSATVFDDKVYDNKSLFNLTYDESLVVQATGKLLMDNPPEYYISKGILSTPMYYRIYNRANEYVRSNDWHLLNKFVIESSTRTELVSASSAFMAFQGFKILILVSTKRHAFKILEVLSSKYNLDDKVRCSFGSSKFHRYDGKNIVETDKSEDTMKLFDEGSVRILIGTSHLYEGADIPNLDAVILAGSGRGTRRFIQGIGRSLRKTKTGKYAHIVDFTDSDNPVLNYHSNHRLDLFRRLVSNKEDNIFRVSFPGFKKIFINNEKEYINKEINRRIES